MSNTFLCTPPQDGCARPGIPGVYATVATEIDWIKEIVCTKSANPPTNWGCSTGNDWVDSTGPNEIKITVTHDNYPRQTSWELVNQNGELLRSQDSFSVREAGYIAQETINVGAGEFTFTLEDLEANGLCCGDGMGSYSITVNGEEAYSGGQFHLSTGPLKFAIDDNGAVTPTVTNPISAVNGAFEIEVIIQHDEFPHETAWELVDQQGQIVSSQNYYDVVQEGQLVHKTFTVQAGDFTFRIDDSYQDGLCCEYRMRGYYQVLVNGFTVLYGDKFGGTSGDLPFEVRGNDNVPALVDPTETYLIVQYDDFPTETGVKLVEVGSGKVVTEIKKGKEKQANAFRWHRVDLKLGKRYKLIAVDSVGDGMLFGRVSVVHYANGEWHSELANISGLSFDGKKRDKFRVPLEGSTPSNKGPSHHRNEKTAFCNNSDGKFTIKGVQKSCRWIDTYWPNTKPFCNNANVAATCPSSCNQCPV